MTMDSKPMWEWMRIAPQRIASVVGFNDPAAKGAIVRGMRPAEIKRSNVQWYEPCDGLAAGTGAGSFATSSSVQCGESVASECTCSVDDLCCTC